MKTKINWLEVERTIGGMKFAVVVILLFTISMIAGTFMESYYGTEFANRLIYKSTPFMFIQFAMFLSIVFATFLRLPIKERLYGFYVIHAGLVTIGIGSLITYVAGVDGSITLSPNDTNRQVIMSKDIFKITYPDEGKQATTFLPFNAFETNLDQEYNNIKIKKFIPFAEGKLTWIDSINKYPSNSPIQSSQYHYKNAFAEQEIVLSLHPEAENEFQSSMSMGPLTMIYLPAQIAECFKNAKVSKVVFWNTRTGECFTPEEKKLVAKMTPQKKVLYSVPYNSTNLLFYPAGSPFPFDSKMQSIPDSLLRILSLEVFEKKPTLFLFGKKASFYSKAEKEWHHEDFDASKGVISLPWMGADIKLLAHETVKRPFNMPVPTIPIQKNGSLIKGGMKSVEVDIKGKSYWVSDNSPLGLTIDGRNIVFEVTKETLNLPFELALTEFKMDKAPGTNMPASYESFVKLFSGEGSTNHHIYMNNPLKVKSFTLYQASYAENENGSFSSTLSVNVDPGRPLKYSGSLMLVLGAIWHFGIAKRNKGSKV